MDKYYVCLKQQFLNAKGLDPSVFDSKDMDDAFCLWVYKLGRIGKLYRKYAEKDGIIFDTPEIAEIGKGRDDTLLPKNSFAKKITDTATIFGTNVIHAKFVINDAEPCLCKNNKNLPFPSNINEIMTHNPYEFDEIMKWGNLHRLGVLDITVGVFGAKDDKDRKEKIKALYDLKAEMQDNYEFLRYDDDNNYYSLITTKKKRKIKKLG